MPSLPEAAVICVLILVICLYALDVRKLYPQFMIELFAEPLGRFCAYILVYLVSLYNIHIGLLLLILVVNLHIDVINFIESK